MKKGTKHNPQDIAPMFPGITIPPEHVMLHDRVTMELESFPFNTEVSRKVSGNKGPPVNISISISSDFLPPTITPFDKMVLEAAITHYRYGNPTFTAATLVRTMNGLSAGDSVSNNYVSLVKFSLDKLSSTSIKLDVTEHYAMLGLPSDCKAHLKAKLLNLEELEFSSSEESYSFYKILSPPPLLTYASTVKHYYLLKPSLLNVKEVIINEDGTLKVTNKRVTMTPTRAQVRDYVIRRIMLMRYAHVKQRTIAFRNYTRSGEINYGICHYVDNDTPSPAEALRIRNYVNILLRYYVAIKFISNFALEKNASGEYAFRIVL